MGIEYYEVIYVTIHVVKAGETLNSIGRQYDVAPGLIARYNGLREPYSLAVGQSLVILIPEELYTVQPGDTLSSVSTATGRSMLQILRDNPNLEGYPVIYPGQTLALGFTQEKFRTIDVSGYAYPFVDLRVLRGILPYATALVPFTYGITAEGGLVDLEDKTLIELAQLYGVVPWMHLSTLTQEGQFSSQLAQTLLEFPATQEKLADAVMAQIVARGYQGLDVDFEYIAGKYAVAYSQFIGQLRQRLNSQGLELIVAVAPKISADQPGTMYEGHDYSLLGQNADGILLMTYEWGYSYGPPMAVAPITAVRQVLDYAVTVIPREKIFLGFPNYAYDWTLPFTAGMSRAISISNEYAVELAVTKGAEIFFDESAQTPYFFYTGEDGSSHEVWFEDARSTYQKLLLVQEYGLRGVGYWNFMRPFTTNFSILNAMYDIANETQPPVA